MVVKIGTPNGDTTADSDVPLREVVVAALVMVIGVVGDTLAV